MQSPSTTEGDYELERRSADRELLRTLWAGGGAAETIMERMKSGKG